MTTADEKLVADFYLQDATTPPEIRQVFAWAVGQTQDLTMPVKVTIFKTSDEGRALWDAASQSMPLRSRIKNETAFAKTIRNHREMHPAMRTDRTWDSAIFYFYPNTPESRKLQSAVKVDPDFAAIRSIEIPDAPKTVTDSLALTR